MRHLVLICAALVSLVTGAPARAESPYPDVTLEPRYLILVTLDGYRWEDLFRGADESLVRDARYRARYVDVSDRAQALTPFLLSFGEEGALIGNRDAGSCARVSNAFWFSYPGYAEMLAGRPNPQVRYNAAVPNQDITVLERLQEDGFVVRAFAEWNTMAAILNVARSNIPLVTPPDYDAPHDPQIMIAARAALSDPPEVLYLALGDTDNRAHEGKYEEYLAAASEADAFLREVWEDYQADPRTAGRTTMIVTSDHGRGAAANERWRGHGSGRWRGIVVPGLRHEGSDAIFIGARGPDVRAGNYGMETCATLSQVAATVLRSIDAYDTLAQPDMAPPLDIFTR